MTWQCVGGSYHHDAPQFIQSARRLTTLSCSYGIMDPRRSHNTRGTGFIRPLVRNIQYEGEFLRREVVPRINVASGLGPDWEERRTNEDSGGAPSSRM